MPVAKGSLKLDSQTIEHKGSPKGAKGSGFKRQGPSNEQRVPPSSSQPPAKPELSLEVCQNEHLNLLLPVKPYNTTEANTKLSSKVTLCQLKP